MNKQDIKWAGDWFKANLPKGVRMEKKRNEPMWMFSHPTIKTVVCWGFGNDQYVRDTTTEGDNDRFDGTLWSGIGSTSLEDEVIYTCDWLMKIFGHATNRDQPAKRVKLERRHSNFDLTRFTNEQQNWIEPLIVFILKELRVPVKINLEFTKSTNGSGTAWANKKRQADHKVFGCEYYQKVKIADPNKDSMTRFLFVLAHELVHIEQFRTGKLSYRFNQRFWKGTPSSKRKPRDHKAYINQPWERDANERALPIMLKIAKEFNIVLDRDDVDREVRVHELEKLQPLVDAFFAPTTIPAEPTAEPTTETETKPTATKGTVMNELLEIIKDCIADNDGKASLPTIMARIRKVNGTHLAVKDPYTKVWTFMRRKHKDLFDFEKVEQGDDLYFLRGSYAIAKPEKPTTKPVKAKKKATPVKEAPKPQPKPEPKPAVQGQPFKIKGLDMDEAKQQQVMDVIEERFGFYAKNVEMVAKGTSRALIVQGSGGTGKTYTAMQVLEKELGPREDGKWTVIEGKCSPVEFFKTLQDFPGKGQVVIVDDADNLMESIDGLNMLKSAMETKGTRMPSWKSGAKTLANDGYETEFIYEGAVIVITNKRMEELTSKKETGGHVSALLTRSRTSDIGLYEANERFMRICQVMRDNPTALQTETKLSHDQCQEVLDWVMEHREQVSDHKFSLRLPYLVAELYSLYLEDGVADDTWKRHAYNDFCTASSVLC